MHEKLQAPVRRVIELLVTHQFSELEALTHGCRFNAHDIAMAIAKYGRHLVTAPDYAFELMNVVEVRDFVAPCWSIVMPLWTQEEGRSDLSLEMTIIETQNGFKIEIDDLHVL